MKLKKAFTLLEMLVVIGIIAVLVGMVTSSYSTAQKKARDAKRQADLKAFQNALEQCYSVNSYSYPTISGNNTTSVSIDCSAVNGPILTITDPTTSKFTVSRTVSTYTVSITLESGISTSITEQQ